jgi:hypothetical protein
MVLVWGDVVSLRKPNVSERERHDALIVISKRTLFIRMNIALM